MMTRFLLLETSTDKGIAALIEDGNVVFEICLPPGLQSSHFLLPELEQALEKYDVSLKSITCIAVGIGPGSYTGIRIGATVAKMLSFAFKIPLVGVCTLRSFIPSKDTVFAAIIDAKIGGVYLQLGKRECGVVSYAEEPKVSTLADAGRQLLQVPVIVTPNATTLRPKFNDISAEWVECYPSAMQMYRIAEDKFRKGEIILDGQLELLYMRKTQAELNLLP